MCISSLDTSCMALNSLSATAPASALAMMDAIMETGLERPLVAQAQSWYSIELPTSKAREGRSSLDGKCGKVHKFCLYCVDIAWPHNFPTSLNSSHNNGGAEFFFFSTFRFRRRI